jgi:hypothetical protein
MLLQIRFINKLSFAASIYAMSGKYFASLKNNDMTWSTTLSTFALNRVCQLLSMGIPMEMTFRDN